MSLKSQLLQSPSSIILELKQRKFVSEHAEIFAPLERLTKRAESAHAFKAHRAALHITEDVINGRVTEDADTGPTCFSLHPTDGRQRNQILVIDSRIPLTSEPSLAEDAVTAFCNAVIETAKKHPTESGASTDCMLLTRFTGEHDRTRTTLNRQFAVVFYDIPSFHDIQAFITRHRHEITEALRAQFSPATSHYHAQ